MRRRLEWPGNNSAKPWRDFDELAEYDDATASTMYRHALSTPREPRVPDFAEVSGSVLRFWDRAPLLAMLPWLLVHSVVLVIAMPMTNSIKNDWFAMALLGVALVAPAPLLLAAGPIQRRIVRKRLRRLVEHPHFAHAKRFCPICRRELRIDPETERLDADGELCTACGAPMID